jgi:2-polyprenyl-6-methoxyphenol hydroxylase-like FAD-dependent oxidoreductase
MSKQLVMLITPLKGLRGAWVCAFPPGMSERVLIIGSGVFGLSTALELAKRGYDVHCFDRRIVPSPSSAAYDTHKIRYPCFNLVTYSQIQSIRIEDVEPTHVVVSSTSSILIDLLINFSIIA